MLSAQPWWTPADQAEVDLLLHEAIRVGANREALRLVIEWRDYRILRSKAAYLRALYPDPPTERRAVA